MKRRREGKGRRMIIRPLTDIEDLRAVKDSFGYRIEKSEIQLRGVELKRRFSQSIIKTTSKEDEIRRMFLYVKASA
jgi:hypothetical protein